MSFHATFLKNSCSFSHDLVWLLSNYKKARVNLYLAQGCPNVSWLGPLLKNGIIARATSGPRLGRISCYVWYSKLWDVWVLMGTYCTTSSVVQCCAIFSNGWGQMWTRSHRVHGQLWCRPYGRRVIPHEGNTNILLDCIQVVAFSNKLLELCSSITFSVWHIICLAHYLSDTRGG